MRVDLGLGGWSPRDEDDPPNNRGKTMGEFADMAVDNIVNGEYGVWCPQSGYGSYHRKQTIMCKHCHSKAVYWWQVESGKWCLHDKATEKPHVCKKFSRPAAVPRVGKNSNMKELTNYKLVTIKCCSKCYYSNGSCNMCKKHDYAIVPRGVCNDWEDDGL